MFSPFILMPFLSIYHFFRSITTRVPIYTPNIYSKILIFSILSEFWNSLVNNKLLANGKADMTQSDRVRSVLITNSFFK
jgi:hypothetical protein